MHGINKISTLIDTRLQVSRNGNYPLGRRWVYIRNLDVESDLCVYNNTSDVVACALLERYYNCEVTPGKFEPPLVPLSGAFDTTWFKFFRAKLVRYAERRVHVYTLQEVVDMYQGPKYRTYQRAMDSVMVDSVKPGDAKLGGFSKFEKCSSAKACRMINPRTARYNIELARYLKKAEKIYYHAIDALFREIAVDSETALPTVIKGYNAVESASILESKWNTFSDPIAVVLDAKKFDMHVSKSALVFEHSVYNSTFRSNKLRKLLKWQLYNRGVARTSDGVIEYSIEATRSSGDINTALGNVILMCSMIFSYIKECNIRAEVGDNGDDCLVIMEQKDHQAFIRSLDCWFAQRGFRMTHTDPVSVFEQIEFCQTNPVFNGTMYIMCRNPKTVMVKDSMCLKPVMDQDWLRRWLYAVGECGGSLSSGIPILQQFYANYRRNGTKCTKGYQADVFRNEGRLFARRGLSVNDVPITDSARYSFWLAFGILPDVQRDLEAIMHYDIGGVPDDVISQDELNIIRVGRWDLGHIYYD